jgi:vitamin B12 transporter
LSAYAGWGVQLDAHGLDIGVRYDDYSDFGGHATGRVAYGYRFTPELKGFAAVASAFKAPTFNDLYLDYPPFYFSNPNLEPERSKNAELGVNYASGGQFIQATLFTSRARDMVVIDPVTFATTVNLDKSCNHGMELSWNGKLAGMDARASLTWQNPEDASTGLPLLRRARRFGSVTLSDRIGKFGWRGELIASGARPDVHASNFTRTKVSGYAVLNLSADYIISNDWKLTGHVLNALDADYSQVHGYATPGRGFRLELAYTPK